MRRTAALLLLVLTACSDGSEGSPTAGTSVAVTATGSECRVATTTVEAGQTRFRVTNDATSAATVGVYAEDQLVTETRDLAPGKSADLDVDLSNGHYELACQAGGPAVRTEFHVEGGGHAHGEGETVDREVAFTARDYAFDGLKGLTATPGDTIRFTMTNAGDDDHEFQVYAPEGNKLEGIGHKAKGEKGETVLTLDAPGTYRYLCAIADHETRGMKGTFDVR